MKRYIFKLDNKYLHVDADNILIAKKIACELYGEKVVFTTIGKVYGLKVKQYGS